MTWKIVRKTPARDIDACCNIFDRAKAEEIAQKLETWAAEGDGAKFVVEEEPKKVE